MSNSTATMTSVQDDVTAETRERDDAAAWAAVCERRAEFLVDGPDHDDEPCGPPREDPEDFMPTASDEEWRLVQLAADRERFARLFAEREEHHKHVDRGPDAGWKGRMFGELARLARLTDATDVGQLVDRLEVLSSQFA